MRPSPKRRKAGKPVGPNAKDMKWLMDLPHVSEDEAVRLILEAGERVHRLGLVLPSAATIGAVEANPEPEPLTKDPFVRRLESLGIKVTRENYLNLVAPGADPDDLDPELEASLPPELRLQGDGDE